MCSSVVIPSIFAFAMLVRSMNVMMKRSMRGGQEAEVAFSGDDALEGDVGDVLGG